MNRRVLPLIVGSLLLTLACGGNDNPTGPAVATLAVTTTSLSNGVQGVDYETLTLAATGGDGSYSWALASGSGPLPSGLTLSADGDITGNPSTSATWDFSVEVTSGLQLVQAALSITVEATLVRICATSAGNMPNYATLAEGVAAVPEGGIVVLCDGVHLADPRVVLDKALTLKPEEGADVTIDGRLAIGHPTGTVEIHGITFVYDGTGSAVSASGTYADVLLKGLTFLESAASFGASTLPDAHVVISESSFLGGQGLLVSGAPQADILDNYFEAQVGTAAASLHYQSGTNGMISRNEFEGCALRGCIRVVKAGTVLIADNTIRTTARTEVYGVGTGVQYGLVADGVDVTAERNLVEGLGPVADPSDPSSYPMRIGALSAVYGQGSTTFRDNVVRNAGVGINGAALSLTASGNIVEDVHTGLRLPSNLTSIDVTRNDITGYIVSLDAFIDPIVTGSVTCNWWGDAAGPQNALSVAVDAYTPFATEPIAGTGRAC